MGRVYANGRSILHKGDGNTHTSAAPDVCKVPTPGGPVPTPFVNSAQDSMLTKGSTSVTIEGHPVALTSSELSTSSGDEPGTAGGLISSKFKGKMAWGSGSVDVKVEGKGVVRYLDVTLHNGNTYNTTFISAGGTGLAYGNDKKCPECGQSGKKHLVLETPQISSSAENIILELNKRYQPQRDLINEHRRLKKERNNLRSRADQEARQASLPLKHQENSRKELLLRQGAARQRKSLEELKTIGAALKELEADLKVEYKKISTIRHQSDATIEAISKEMDRINTEIGAMNPVLDLDHKENTFTKGYMVGACTCKCVKAPKLLAARSGTLSKGFQAAVISAGFTPVTGFQPSPRQQAHLQREGRRAWECAAPQLLKNGRAQGHSIKTLSERLYAPEANPQVTVTYEHVDTQGKRKVTETFSHGDSVPSCKDCQKLLPEMLCYNHLKCP
ncbi:DUF4150 domain-containing protein [Myxococcus sp. CA040A]|uniref:DUF4150 domain-containing protein n=1 Tax=Myxococcus sp. CA040A TaxID=2741738 RepID=UPI0020C65623|nr:PAAR-like domain-containing protein [Myxococcus sp. CA040A]